MTALCMQLVYRLVPSISWLWLTYRGGSGCGEYNLATINYIMCVCVICILFVFLKSLIIHEGNSREIHI